VPHAAAPGQSHRGRQAHGGPLNRATAANVAWWLSYLPEAVRFHAATHRVQQTQHEHLTATLQRNQACAYGRQYGFADIRDADTYRNRVPLVQFAELPNARSLCSEPILLLEPTSGTEASKLIPYTKTLKAEFQRGIAPWIVDLYARNPALFGGRAYWSITPPPQHPQRSAEGIPVGFEDDAAYLGGWAGWLVRQALAVDSSHLRGDYLDATLQQLRRCPDLRLISVWSPTFLLLLLERLAERPAQLWPQLRCISCWGDGPSAAYLPALQKAFPGVFIQPKGLLSTEAFCSLPLGFDGHALAIRSHFFEFLDSNDNSYLAHEVQPGCTYQVVVTTGGGLYRYRLGDQVLVTGQLRQCPLLTFQQRAGGISDHFGEKLSPELVAPHLPAGAFLAYDNGAYTLFGDDPAVAARQLETALLQSFHYKVCRDLGQLGPVRAFQLGPGAWDAFYTRLQTAGRRPGDVKPAPLRLETDWSRWLPGEFV
jgi:hypothetical protein